MITIVYFASIKEKLGMKKETLEYREGMTLEVLLSELKKKHPGFKELGASKKFLYAINHEVSKFETPLTDGDEVAILPPLSGGI